MSKFTRVSENDSEQSVVNRFASRQEQPTNDAFAELLAGTNERRAQISRETVDVKRERKLLKESEHEWEKPPVVASYKQPSMSKPFEEANPEDLFSSAIRRAFSGVEEDLNPRMNPADFGLMDREGYEDMLHTRMATMHHPDVFEMEDYLKGSMEEKGYFDKEGREEKRAKKMAEWQTAAKHHAVRERNKVTARANPILLQRSGQSVVRVGEDNVAASKFGAPINIHDIVEQEVSRFEMKQHQKEAKDSLRNKRIMTSEERHNDWESNIEPRSRSMQDHSSSWLDNYVKGIQER